MEINKDIDETTTVVGITTKGEATGDEIMKITVVDTEEVEAVVVTTEITAAEADTVGEEADTVEEVEEVDTTETTRDMVIEVVAVVVAASVEEEVAMAKEEDTRMEVDEGAGGEMMIITTEETATDTITTSSHPPNPDSDKDRLIVVGSRPHYCHDQQQSAFYWDYSPSDLVNKENKDWNIICAVYKDFLHTCNISWERYKHYSKVFFNSWCHSICIS